VIGIAVGWVLLVLAYFALPVSALPALPMGTWWVRVPDYPRLQLLIAMMLLVGGTILAAVLLPHWRRR